MLSIPEYVNKMKKTQQMLLDYFEAEDNEEYENQNLSDYFEEQKIVENKYELKSILYLISKIAENHQRANNINNKIFGIIIRYENEIKNYFNNMEIFNIFKRNKQILLFLFEQGIIIPSKSMFCIISTGKFKENFYPEFFYPEFQSFFDLKPNADIINNEETNNFELFNEKRKNGENDSKICQLIQKDSIKEFVIMMNKTNLSKNYRIKTSIFETNTFLLENKEYSLIEYATFCGSIQIFQYLLINNAKMSSSLWLYAIHGKNSEIIHKLEENRVKMPKDSLIQCFRESVKCHHIELMNYFKNFFERSEVKLYPFCFKFFNFIELAEYDDCLNGLFKNASDCIDDSLESKIFYYLCKYDCFSAVEFLVQNEKVNVNAKKIK